MKKRNSKIENSTSAKKTSVTCFSFSLESLAGYLNKLPAIPSAASYIRKLRLAKLFSSYSLLQYFSGGGF